MRTAAVVLPAVALLALLGCDPPLEENVAPFVDVITPRTLAFADGSEETIAYVTGPVEITLSITDRDGDTDFRVELFRDDTPDLVDDAGGLTSLAQLDVVDLAPGAELVLTGADPLTTVEQVLVVQVDDGRRDGVRTVRLVVTPRGAEDPTICWNGGADCVAAGLQPDTDDALSGTLPDVRADEYYESFWLLAGEDAPDTGILGPSAARSASDTAKGETHTFCVRRWLSTNGGERPDALPDASTCTSVEIGNAAPGVPPNVTPLPERPVPGTPLFCAHDDAMDPDSDVLSYGYLWNDGTNPLGTGEWLDPSDVLAGTTHFCVVTASDGTTDGASGSGAGINVRNTNQDLSGLPSPDTANYETGEVHVLAAHVLQRDQPHYAAGFPAASSGEGLLKILDANGRVASYRGGTGEALGRSLAAADLDGDGVAELVVGGQDVFWVFPGYDAADSSSGVPVPASTGTLPLPSTYLLTGTLTGTSGYGQSLVTGDFAANGSPGVMIPVAPVGSDPFLVRVAGISILGTGAVDLAVGSLPQIAAPAGDAGFGSSLAVGDVNGDGRDDLLVGNPGGATAEALLFTDVVADTVASDAFVRFIGLPAGGLHSLTLADVDGDGSADVFLGTDDGVGVFFATSLVAGDLDWSARDVLITSTAGLGSRLERWPDPSGLFGDAVVVEDASGDVVYLFDGDDLGTSAVDALAASFTVADNTGGEVALVGPPTDITGDGFPDLVLTRSTGVTAPNHAYFVKSEF